MPITQDRLITLIDIATQATDYATRITTLVFAEVEDQLRGIAWAISKAENPDQKSFLEELQKFFLILRALNEEKDLLLNPVTMRQLIQEQEHFRANAKKNASLKSYQHRRRIIIASRKERKVEEEEYNAKFRLPKEEEKEDEKEPPPEPPPPAALPPKREPKREPNAKWGKAQPTPEQIAYEAEQIAKIESEKGKPLF